uniref:Uncharacterized protein n=1 Tax=Rhodosorus marinus TaxID=101924 RepID=A0A7S3EA11_9RHOD|mmetsp:Transcript_17613/g.71200  ORF Transcript_17613/g.71200 Transcript_17613/m.71200 type:complete len:189 (+) Transcript_17613:71-637(+)
MFGFVVGIGNSSSKSGRRQASTCPGRSVSYRCRVFNSIETPAPVDSSFELADEVREGIASQLSEEEYLNKIALSTNSVNPKFTGVLFKPRSWTEATPRGVPTGFDRYLEDPLYKIVHVPQLVLIQAGCFKPSQLCAVFRAESIVENPSSSMQQPVQGDEWDGLGETIRSNFENKELHEDDDDLDNMVI